MARGESGLPLVNAVERLFEKLRGMPTMLIFVFVLVSYFLATAGIAYDMINEPPAVGGVADPDRPGVVKPQAFMPGRLNGQYIMEGMCGGFFYTLGGVGIVLLDLSQNRKTDLMYRTAFRIMGVMSVLGSYFAIMQFIRIKMPSYMH